MSSRVALIALVLSGTGCDETGPPAPDAQPLVPTTVVFSYPAPTALDPEVEVLHRTCWLAVVRTHIHTSWNRWQVDTLTAVEADLFETTYDDVPADSLTRIRVNDPNECENHPLGAVTSGVFANGVELTTVVDTPGSGGPEPGFSFTVAPDGTVTP